MIVRGRRGWWDGRVDRCLKRFHSPTGTCASVCAQTQQSGPNENTISLSPTHTHIDTNFIGSIWLKSLAKRAASNNGTVIPERGRLAITRPTLGWDCGFVFLNLEYKRQCLRVGLSRRMKLNQVVTADKKQRMSSLHVSLSHTHTHTHSLLVLTLPDRVPFGS